MNRVELIARISGDLTKKLGRNVPQTEVKPIVEHLFEVLKERLYQEEEISIAGFGKFGVKKRDARTGRNPQTGESLEIAAKNAVFFKASKELKEYIQD